MKDRHPKACRDCGVKPGEYHVPGCDTERCALCGGQVISCGCVYATNGLDPSTLEEEHPTIWKKGPTDAMYEALDAAVAQVGGRLPWTGEWPGVVECQELGFFCKDVEGEGRFHVPCAPDDPEGHEDLNRLYVEGTWNVKERRMVVSPRYAQRTWQERRAEDDRRWEARGRAAAAFYSARTKN